MAPTSAPAPQNPSPHPAAIAPPATNTLATGITGSPEDVRQRGIDETSGNGAAPPSKSASQSSMTDEQEESELNGSLEHSSLNHCIANLDDFLLGNDKNNKNDCVSKQSVQEDRLIKRKKTDEDNASEAKSPKTSRKEASNGNAMELDGHSDEAQAVAKHAASSASNTSADSLLQESSSSQDSTLNHCIMNLTQLKRQQTGDEEATEAKTANSKPLNSNNETIKVDSQEGESRQAVQRESSSASNTLNSSSRQESSSPRAEATNRHEWSVEEFDEEAALDPFRRSLSPISSVSEERLTGFDIPEGFYCELEEYTVNGKKVPKTPPTSPSSIASSTSSCRSPETIIRRLRIMVEEEADRPYDYGQIYRVEKRRSSLSDIREDDEPEEEEVDNGWFEAMMEEEYDVVDAMDVDEAVSETGDESDAYETADEGSNEESEDELDGIDFDDTEEIQIDGSSEAEEVVKSTEEAVDEHDQAEDRVDEEENRCESQAASDVEGADEDVDMRTEDEVHDGTGIAATKSNEIPVGYTSADIHRFFDNLQDEFARSPERIVGSIYGSNEDDKIYNLRQQNGGASSSKRQARSRSSPVSSPKNPRLDLAQATEVSEPAPEVIPEAIEVTAATDNCKVEEKDNENTPEKAEKEDSNDVKESENVSEENESTTIDKTPAATAGQVGVESEAAEDVNSEESAKNAESVEGHDVEHVESKKGKEVSGKDTDSNEQAQRTSPTNPEDAQSHHEAQMQRVRSRKRQLTKYWLAIQERINEQNALIDSVEAGNAAVEPSASSTASSPSKSTPKAPSREPSLPAIDQGMPQHGDDSQNEAAETQPEEMMDQSEVPPHASTIEAASIDRRQAGTSSSPVMPTNPAGTPSPRTSTPSKPRRSLALIQEGVRKVTRDQQIRMKELKKNLGSQWPSPKTILGAAPTQSTKLRTTARLEELLARIDEQGRLNRDYNAPTQQTSNDDAPPSTVSVVEGIQRQLKGANRIQPTTEEQQAFVPTASNTAPIHETQPSEPMNAEVANEIIDRAASPDIQSAVGPNGYIPERLYYPRPMYIGAEGVESESNRPKNGNESDDSFLHFLRDESMRSANSSPARSAQYDSESDSESVNLSSFDAMIDDIVSTLRDMERNPENQARIRKMANLLEKTDMKGWSPNHMEYVRHDCPICNQTCHQRPFLSDDEASESECGHFSRPTTPPPTTPMPAEDIEETRDEPIEAEGLEDSTAYGNAEPMETKDGGTINDVPAQTPKSPPATPEDVPKTHEPAVEDISMFSDDGNIEDGVNGGLEMDDGANSIVPMNDSDFEPFNLEDFEEDSAIDRPEVMPEAAFDRPPTPQQPSPMSSRSSSPIVIIPDDEPMEVDVPRAKKPCKCGPHCRCPRLFGPPKNRRPSREAPFRRANPRQNRRPIKKRDRKPRHRQTDPEFGRLQHVGSLQNATLPDAPPVVNAEHTAVVDGIQLDPSQQVSFIRGRNFEAALYSPGVVVLRGYFEGGSIASALLRQARSQPVTLFNQPDDPAVQIAGGPNHLIILTESGRIHTIGRAVEGQLGVGDPSKYRQGSVAPAKMLRRVYEVVNGRKKEVKFAYIKAGGNVTIGETENGKEFGCGEVYGPTFTRIN